MIVIFFLRTLRHGIFIRPIEFFTNLIFNKIVFSQSSSRVKDAMDNFGRITKVA